LIVSPKLRSYPLRVIFKRPSVIPALAGMTLGVFKEKFQRLSDLQATFEAAPILRENKPLPEPPVKKRGHIRARTHHRNDGMHGNDGIVIPAYVLR
jgi:hypothetical protein